MALSSVAARSQIQSVVGESSSLVARRFEEASKEASEHPTLRSAVDLLSK